MSQPLALLLTDIVDSTALNDRLGDAAMAALWVAHDAAARELLRQWHGREIGRSDGFLLLFDTTADAVGFALAYHQALTLLPTLLLGRVGLHVGPVQLRENSSQDRALGATPFEIDGVALPLAARVAALAQGGQTLATADALAQLPNDLVARQSFGHWRLKGIAEPVELFGLTESPDAPNPGPPPDAPKAYRVTRVGDAWLPSRDIPHNLPAERDAFFGRLDVLQALAGHVEGGARLMTLLGIGGIGKTRTALRFARAYLGHFPGGAWFCDLSQATGLDGVAHAVAHALDVPLGQTDPVVRLGAAVRGRGPCLVILDNFEQVARHAEHSLGCWLAAAPQATFVVTSRELLGIAGEQVVNVLPLSPDDAAALFISRAKATGPEGGLTGIDAEIHALIDTLDRLPLAIELAAARAPLMTPAQMLARMKQRFKLLAAVGGRHGRQSTLRATIDWSWELLDNAERLALAQLSVFEGGFSLRAAEAALELSPQDGAPWVGDVLHSLLSKSLVRRGPGHRFELLRSIQDYAAERLAAQEDVAGGQLGAMRRHWRHFASYTETEATAERCADADNLVIACARAAATEPEFALGTLEGAWAALHRVGPVRAALPLVEAIESSAAPAPLRGSPIDRVMGSALALLGDHAGARARWNSCLAIASAQHDTDTHVLAICQLADLDMTCGDYPSAEAALERALALARRAAKPQVLLGVLNHRGILRLELSQWDGAQRDTTEALALAHQLGDRRWLGGLHGNLGTIAHSQGRLSEAQTHYQAALSMARDVGDRQWEGNNRCNFGLLLHEMGDDAGARAELEEALKISRSIGHMRLEATCLCNLGIVMESLGDRAGASRHYEASVATAKAFADPRIEAQFRGYWGLCLARMGVAADASACLHQAVALLEPLNDLLSLAIVQCQSAIAAALAGDRLGWQSQLARADALLAPLALGPDSEAMRLLAQARAGP